MPANLPAAPKRSFVRRTACGCALGCGGLALVFAVLVVVFVVALSKPPTSYPMVSEPIPPPPRDAALGGGLDGFSSPYLGHTGSWDGKGGGMFGSSKNGDMDVEQAMGLRWTFMAAYWRELEPAGPVNLELEVPPAWQALDRFVIEAHRRRLNVLMQAPVVGGNAGGPPKWAGRRTPGKSAPENMAALADFAGKLAERYRPGGTLARREGWGATYGVRAWELDNEPESYFTNWQGQAADYAEFVTLAAAKMRAADPQAVIVAPSLAAGKHGLEWLRETLDATDLRGSPAFRANARPYSIGPVTDVVSFHNYEGLDSAFNEGRRTITHVFSDVRAVFEEMEQRVPGFAYPRKQEYWHTEGNYDFLGVMSAERRAAWRFQFYTRAFAAGIRKVIVMDASPPEQVAMRAYVAALPNPFPMLPATSEITIVRGEAAAFRHPGETATTWIVWALAGKGDATIGIPVKAAELEVIAVTGEKTVRRAEQGRLSLVLPGDEKMAAPFLVIEPTR